jgi:membrane peptidoglycan carboxypeptidase
MALVWGGLTYKDVIYDEPGEHLSAEHIRSVIAQESPVMFRDGKTRIGVFFAREHREYVPFDEIPKAWVTAIVAAEDKRFWDHGGVDFLGIIRAMIRNVRAGRMVAGGSTLTQQTAKNLYYRPDRSLKSKWTELLNALRLEARYTKEEILEFYANQFHVSSNGRGLGIGARYFFDKTIAELDTLECAFLAGLVKAPARYNPFVGQTAEERGKARKRAKERTRYVLDRMLNEGFLTTAVHTDLIHQDLVFQKGRFQYESNVVLDEVEARLSQAPFPTLFGALDIDNPSTAGISIVTTLDEAVQRGSTYALWHHLSDVGPSLEGNGLAGFRLADDEAPRFDPSRTMAAGTFHAAKIAQSDPLSLQLPSGVCGLDKTALQRAADIVARSVSGNAWARGGEQERSQLRNMLMSGTPVMASVRVSGENPICDLEQRPVLQGAVMVLENGRIRSMVGGNDNRNFNRAITARRQFGSIWKPVLYNAAMQLGWTPTDVIDNRSNVFHFEGTWYYPRADHDNVDWTSLAWLGTRSENLGSIWLMTHLTDHLGPQQFQRLAGSLGLTRGENEEWMEFVRRIRDDEGVISTKARLPEMAFRAAQLEMLGDMGTEDPEARVLRSLFYGRGIEEERTRVRKSGQRVQSKLESLGRSYRALAAAGTVCLKQLQALDASLDLAAEAAEVDGLGIEDFPEFTDPDHPQAPDFEQFTAIGIRDDGLVCGEPDEETSRVDIDQWWDWVRGAASRPALRDTVVGGEIRMGTLTQLHASMKRRILVWSAADPYELDVLQYHPDYRILVGLRYMDKLARTFGVKERLPPVLSMPLGAVDISIEEAATLYQGLMDGQTWSYPGLTESGPVAAPDHTTQLIAEIRDRNGRVLYRADPVPKPQADPAPGRLVGDILRNVVQWGTGRRAYGAIKANDVTVPVAGKTGTTNGYRNAAFAGFVPRFGEEGWEWSDGYTVVTYVGYDDNRSMRRKSVKLQGSNGALPVWIGTAQALADAGLLGEPPAESWSRLSVERGYSVLPVAEGTGLVLNHEPEEIKRTVLIEGVDEARRRFAPVGMAVPKAMDLVMAHGGAATEPPEAAALEDWLGEDPTSVWQQIEASVPPPAEAVIEASP